MAEARAALEEIFRAALDAVDGEAVVARTLTGEGASLAIAGRPLDPAALVSVLAIGKAAAPMMRAVEGHAASRIDTSLVITKPGFGLPLAQADLIEAGHPVPDAESERAGRAALGVAAHCTPRDLLVVLLSGGASALTSTPVKGLDLADLAATSSALLACGADIAEMNAVRKHTSAIAGGGLARAAGAARIELLVISDVPGDDPSVIGSGPCTPDPTSYRDALDVVERYRLREVIPRRVVAHLEAGCRGERAETPTPGDAAFEQVATTLVACNADARSAAVRAAEARGMAAIDLGEVLTGEARELAGRLVAQAVDCGSERETLLVAGGESTVTVSGATGRGGRNQELALAAAQPLARLAGVTLLAAGTDGNDGPTDAAGAVVDAGTLSRAAALGLDVDAALANHDAYGLLDREGGLLRTGPTRTNVMDLVLIHLRGGSRA